MIRPPSPPSSHLIWCKIFREGFKVWNVCEKIEVHRFRRSFVHLQNWFPPRPWQGKGTWLSNKQSGKLSVHFYCAICKTKQADIKQRTHRGTNPQWFSRQEKNWPGVHHRHHGLDKLRRGALLLLRLETNTDVHPSRYLSRHVARWQNFFGGNIHLIFNWKCFGFTIICRSNDMHVNITAIFLEYQETRRRAEKPAGGKRSSPQDSNPMPSGWSRCTSLTCGRGSICDRLWKLQAASDAD